MEIIKLNLIPSGVNPTCHCSQYDNGRVIRIDLFDGLTPYVLQSGDTVTLNVRKPDNTIIETSLTATQGNTYVNLVTTEQMCACVGYNLCDLTITNGSTVIGTLNFIMQVERDVLADGIPSQSVIEDLDALVAEAVAEDLGDNYYTKQEVDVKLDLKADTSKVNFYVDEFTKTMPESKQIFDLANLKIVKGITENGSGSFVENPRGAVVVIGDNNYNSGDTYSFNCLSSYNYTNIHIDKANIIASNVYPEKNSSYLQIGSSSGANKRGTITLSNNCVYLLISIYLANGYNVDTYDFTEFLSTLVVRKGGYDTTYYPYRLLDVNEQDLSEQLQDKIKKEYRQIYEKTLNVGSSILTEDQVNLGAGWSGDIATGFTHSTGSVNDLKIQNNTTNNKAYLVTFNLTNPAEEAVNVKIGNSALVDVYNGTNEVYVGIIADGGYLSVIPSTNWSGSITNLKLREIQTTGDEVNVIVKNVNTENSDSNITGFWNIVIGYENFNNNENGNRNISIGYGSFNHFKSGTRNIGLGTFALNALISGDRNIAIGADALWKATKAKDCIAIGKASMEGAGDDLSNNIAIGTQTLKKVKTGKDNVAIGYGAMANSQDDTSERNTIIGSLAGFYSNGNNTALGYRACYYNKGKRNTCIGESAGSDLYATGDNNTFLGANSGIDNTGATVENIKTVNGSIAVGNGVKVNKSNQMILGSSNITEVVLCGNKKIIFNNDGTVTWEAIT